MTFDDIVKIYDKMKKLFGKDVYEHISEILEEVKKTHKKDFRKNPTPNKDHEQSWKGFKGHILEKLIIHIIKDEVEELGLKIVEGNKLERTNMSNLPDDLRKLKRSILIDFDEWGAHLPDADIIIYNPADIDIKKIAIISIKSTLRERIAQTGYWKLKLCQDPDTKDVKVYFITPDEDCTLSSDFSNGSIKKGRAIVEVDTDGSYLMCKKDFVESIKVKSFDKFIDDIKDNLLNK